VPLPTFTSEPPLPPNAPPSWIVPLTVVERLLRPTVSWFWPSRNVPAPAIEPAVTWLVPAGPDVPEKSTMPPALAMSCALPPVALFWKNVVPPELVMTVTLPAVLVSKKRTVLLLVMKALPPVLVSWNSTLPKLVMATMPAEAESNKRRRPGGC
jgi:hypothetical protein